MKTTFSGLAVSVFFKEIQSMISLFKRKHRTYLFCFLREKNGKTTNRNISERALKLFKKRRRVKKEKKKNLMRVMKGVKRAEKLIQNHFKDLPSKKD